MVDVRRIEEPRFNIKEREKTGRKHWRGTPTNDSMWPMRSYFFVFCDGIDLCEEADLGGPKISFSCLVSTECNAMFKIP